MASVSKASGQVQQIDERAARSLQSCGGLQRPDYTEPACNGLLNLTGSLLRAATKKALQQVLSECVGEKTELIRSSLSEPYKRSRASSPAAKLQCMNLAELEV